MSDMKFWLVAVLVLIALLPSVTLHESFAEKGTFVDEVKFIQYLDENTALEEVRNGNLDIYFFRVSSDRIESDKAREGIQVFESTGGSYSMLVNPSVSESFNPFSITELRFALNYLIDRNLIVNELIGGYGNTMISNYGIFSADYLSIIEELESFHFKYNPALADEIISHELEEVGAEKVDGYWYYDGEQIEITFFIRSDDPVRKSIGEILASELEKIGFKVNKDFGDLNKAFVVVYGSNPADQKWHLYTEGWGSSGFAKYDSVGLAQMYSPWFSNMPGNNDPTYWNYKNDYIDSITKKIYVSDFKSAEERSSLIKQATREGLIREQIHEASFSSDKTYQVTSYESSGNASIDILGFANRDTLGNSEIFGVTPNAPEGYASTSSGEFPAIILYGMAGMAAIGGAAIMIISQRKLKKEGTNLQQTGIDPSQLTGVQTSASSGGYQTIRGEAQVKGLEDYNQHSSYYDEEKPQVEEKSEDKPSSKGGAMPKGFESKE